MPRPSRLVILLLALVSLVAAACNPNGAVINIYSPDDKLKLPSTLVFSTVDELSTPGKVLTIKNVGSETLNVTGMAITGTNATAFRLAPGSDTSFALGPGASTTRTVEFVPPAWGLKAATLEVDSNDPVQPTDTVALRGYDSEFYEAAGEPSRVEVVDTFDYGTNVGVGATCSAPTCGEEVLSPYWKRANTAIPVTLIPIARYSTRTAGPTGGTGWYPQGNSGAKTTLYNFAGCNCPDPFVTAGGQNQKLLPVQTGTTTFAPGGNFGLFLTASGATAHSDDNLNAGGTHDWRFWPAELPDGTRIANAWIAGEDLGGAGATKNYDYNDFMYLLLNAIPA